MRLPFVLAAALATLATAHNQVSPTGSSVSDAGVSPDQHGSLDDLVDRGTNRGLRNAVAPTRERRQGLKARRQGSKAEV
ncbi:hypothetical protein GQ53DRAFT_818051 [Thozetella sp. PMI_491]|nr:hypothetical protein GQ53DRAFT_818051 [Thozetella sp. PMI_491]